MARGSTCVHPEQTISRVLLHVFPSLCIHSKVFIEHYYVSETMSDIKAPEKQNQRPSFVGSHTAGGGQGDTDVT